MKKIIPIFFFLSLVLIGCEQVPTPKTPTTFNTPIASSHSVEHQILKLANFTNAKITSDSIIGDLATFKANFFAPWQITPNILTTIINDTPGKGTEWLQKYLDDPEYYGENKQRHSQKLKNNIKTTANYETFPNAFKKAITVQNTNLRRLPTTSPAFDVYTKAGEGFPFDYFQESRVLANTPVLVVHYSKDRAWVYVLTAFYKGWIKTNAVALVDDGLVQRWQSQALYAILEEDCNLLTIDQHFIEKGKIGMVLPLASATNGKRLFFVATRNTKSQALINMIQLQPHQVGKIPLPFTLAHLMPLMQQIEGNPYGWGGYLGHRDCSATIRDLYIPFGKILPRNSTSQKTCGSLDIDFPDNSAKKLALIKEKGIPFRTILYKKGHSMLYVGQDENGVPLIFHTIWGLKPTYQDARLDTLLQAYPLEGMHRDKTANKFHGRIVIGRTILSPVTLGQGIASLEKDVLGELLTMTVLE